LLICNDLSTILKIKRVRIGQKNASFLLYTNFETLEYGNNNELPIDLVMKIIGLVIGRKPNVNDLPSETVQELKTTFGMRMFVNVFPQNMEGIQKYEKIIKLLMKVAVLTYYLVSRQYKHHKKAPDS